MYYYHLSALQLIFVKDSQNTFIDQLSNLLPIHMNGICIHLFNTNCLSIVILCREKKRQAEKNQKDDEESPSSSSNGGKTRMFSCDEVPFHRGGGRTTSYYYKCFSKADTTSTDWSENMNSGGRLRRSLMPDRFYVLASSSWH